MKLLASTSLLFAFFQGQTLASYLKLDVTIPLKTDDQEAKNDLIFDQVLSKIKPNWTRAGLKQHVFVNGLTNSMSKYWNEDAAADDTAVMFRVNGQNTDALIDREQELKDWDFLAEHDLAAEIFATFNNGLAFEFIEGSTVDTQQIRDPKIYPLIAKEIARVHWSTQKDVQAHYNLTAQKFRRAAPYSTVTSRKWLKLIQNDLNSTNPYAPSDILPDKYNKSPNNWVKKQVTQNRKEIKEFIFAQSFKNPLYKNDKTSKFFPLQRVFTHHDLLGGNMLYNADLEKVNFIDFEYSGLDDPVWDIANHFNEYVGLDILDQSAYEKDFPGAELIEDFVANYVEETYSTAREDFTEVQKEDFKNLIYLVDLYVENSHLLWGIWANLEVNLKGEEWEGFDYQGYGKLRLEQYWIRKQRRVNGKNKRIFFWWRG